VSGPGPRPPRAQPPPPPRGPGPPPRRRPPRSRRGYTTTGGSEGNLEGILVGRENLPDARLFSSAEAHYSVFKAARLLRMEHVVVAARARGEMGYGALREALARNRAEGRGAVVSLNVGTTVKGAIDDVREVRRALREAGYGEGDAYVHADAALFGTTLPFAGPEARRLLRFDEGIDSVSVSGHKFVGVPMPSGVFLGRRSKLAPLHRDVEYIGGADATIAGSRSGIVPVYLW